MKNVTALALFLLSISLTAQIEHAPTVAQCQADQRLWLSQLEGNGPLPGFYALQDQLKEMHNCRQVDAENRIHYFNTSAEIQAEQFNRLAHFLDRHNLMGKFILEDIDGKR